MSVESDVVEFIRERPGSTSVDLLLGRIVPGAEGTLWIIPILRRLSEEGRIVPLPSLYRDHVSRFPGAHMVGAGLLAEQATRWTVAESRT